MYDFQEVLTLEFLGHTVWDFAVAFLLFLGLLIVFLIFKKVVVIKLQKFSRKTRNEIDDQIVTIIESVPSFFYYVLALYFPLKMVSTGAVMDKIVTGVFVIVVIFQIVRSLQFLLEYVLKTAYERGAEKKKVMSETMMQGLSFVIRIVLWSVGVLLILSNLGFNINSLIASLGIGGIAIALAVQNILGDIFSSFSIYFDRPFEVGDYIIVGADQGNVKKIGLKTTRITSLQGEEIVISNRELTSSRVQNFKKMKERRVVFAFGLVYETDAKKLKKVPEIVEKVISGVDLVRFDRCHFKEFGDFSLNFEVVYYVLSKDYRDYMDKQQDINLGIKEAFENEKLEMAFPTQTVYVSR